MSYLRFTKWGSHSSTLGIGVDTNLVTKNKVLMLCLLSEKAIRGLFSLSLEVDHLFVP